MIPKNIRKEHVLKAICEIDQTCLPQGRLSKKYILLFNGKTYPPKYTISLANNYANGRELDAQQFNGGLETNSFLERLGFTISRIQKVSIPSRRYASRQESRRVVDSHYERCPACKENIYSLLKTLYGRVEKNHVFSIKPDPEEFSSTAYYKDLLKIYHLLQKYRGFQTFIKTRTLPNCDYYMPAPGFILEFDETQHFTESRKLSLQNYPDALRLGFNKYLWIELCKKIEAHDNDPPYRDEQRA